MLRQSSTSSVGPMEHALHRENERLRSQLQALLDEARLNEKKLRRLDHLEQRLIATRSLHELIQLLLQDYRTACDIDAVTLVLADPEHEIARILEGEARGSAAMPGLVLLEKLFSDSRTPYLGAFDADLPGAIFDPWPSGCQSMVILPLQRQGVLSGSINFGSCQAARFAADSGTDFLQRLASIFSICLENALNHERLKLVGLTDPLTGVSNRRYFESRCRDEIAEARRHQHPLACMFLDIDKFKRINDTLGHLAGDEVLRNVARLIRQQLRSSDVIARYGGEEFVVLLPRTGLRPAGEIAERIRTSVAAQPMQPLPGEGLPVTISIGVALMHAGVSDDDNVLAEKIVNAADAALYQAKQAGRNRVVCAD